MSAAWWAKAGGIADCASCGQRGQPGRRQEGDGPHHCYPCWGESQPTMDAAPDSAIGKQQAASPYDFLVPAKEDWWKTAEVQDWLARSRSLLAEREHTVSQLHPPPSQAVFRVVLDPKNQVFEGVGADKVWPAAELLCRYLTDAYPAGYHAAAVELGAGVGVAGMLLASRGCRRVVLTDLPWLLPLTALNVDANFEPTDPWRPRVAPLRWGNGPDAVAIPHSPELAIGSDVLYYEEDVKPLLDTVQV